MEVGQILYQFGALLGPGLLSALIALALLLRHQSQRQERASRDRQASDSAAHEEAQAIATLTALVIQLNGEVDRLTREVVSLRRVIQRHGIEHDDIESGGGEI